MMAERLFSGMLSARLDEIAQQPNAPFLAAQTSRGIFVRTAEVTSLNALVAQGGVERGLTALFTEIDRVARFGFTATELDRQARGLQRVLENATVEKNKSPSGPLADEFIRNFLQGEPIPGIVYEYALNQRFLPEITLAEINALAKEWAPDRNRVVAIIAPEKDKATLPDAARMTAAIAAASGRPLDAYVDTVSTQPLLEPLPSPGRIATTSTNEPLGITEWRLSNGVRVVLKPTTFKEDEIVFRAISPGGTSLAPDRDFIAAETADAVVAQGGLGKLRSLDLSKALAGRSVSVRADIGETEEGLGGGSSRKDLETMFQLIYLTFTAPRPDPVAFGVFKEQLKVALANQDALPDTAFEDALSAALTQNHLRARPIEGRQRRRDEPRPIARVLQGALCRCERLHLRVRRELRSGGHEAARGALPGQPSGSSSERIGEGRRDSSSGGHRRARGEKRHRAEEPGEHRVHADRFRTTRCTGSRCGRWPRC